MEITQERKKEIKYILILIIPFLLFSFYTISQFKQLPSPLYGGDYYLHYGIAKHIYNGNAPWTDPQIQGEYNFYGWFYHALVAYTAKFLGLDLFNTFLYFPLISIILSGVIAFYLGKKIFKKDVWAFTFAFSWIGIYNVFIEMHPRPLAVTVLMPLFILTFLNLIEDKSAKNKVLFGISYGLLGLTHLMSFASASLFIAVYFAYDIISGFMHKEDKFKKAINSFVENLKLFYQSIILGFIVALPYIGFLIFHYKFKLLNNQPEYSAPMPGFHTITDFLSMMFFDKSNIIKLVMSLVVLVGAFYIFTNKEKFKTIFLLFISTLIGAFYYFVTLPLGIKILVYWQIPVYTQQLAMASLLTLGLVLITGIIKNDEWKKYAVICIFIILIIGAGITATNKYNNQWVAQGRVAYNTYFDMAKWVDINIGKNDVFLSSKETSFAFNALTGRKLVVNRITHASQFVDFDKREVGASIILYGNNTNEIKSLLKKYNISYVYYDSQWMEFIQWDPFMVNPKNSAILDKFGVQYNRVKTRLDPGKTDVPVYDLLFIKYDKLWSDNFNKFVYPVMYWGDYQNPEIIIFAINKTMLMQ